MGNKKIIKMILNIMQPFIFENQLNIIRKECDRWFILLCLSDGKNYIHFYQGFHPYDYPFEFSVGLGKIELLKSPNLKDTTFDPMLPLWWFDKNYNPVYKEDCSLETIIDSACIDIMNYFTSIQKMSLLDFKAEYDRFINRNK